jgi:hypothetical protein
LKLRQASSWYPPKLPITGGSLAGLVGKLQRKATRGSGSLERSRFQYWRE